MFVFQSCVAGIALAATLLASSCDTSIRATPATLSIDVHTRTIEDGFQPNPFQCPERVVGRLKLGNGQSITLIDTDCDGFPDLARDGHQQWDIDHLPGQPPTLPSPGWLTPPPRELPYLDPGFGERSAEEWIEATGLGNLVPGGGSTQEFKLNAISTTNWFLDITLPSTSQCRRPGFSHFDLAYQWDVLPSAAGPDFETWRVAGDLDEVLKFLVECGVTSMAMETDEGALVIALESDGSGVSVTLDELSQYWIPLD